MDSPLQSFVIIKAYTKSETAFKKKKKLIQRNIKLLSGQTINNTYQESFVTFEDILKISFQNKPFRKLDPLFWFSNISADRGGKTNAMMIMSS